MTALADPPPATPKATRRGEMAAARRWLAEIGAEEELRKLVESAPPVSVETKARLAAILRG